MESSINPPLLNVSTGPHIRAQESVQSIMFWVAMALIPALAASVYFFGPRALIATALATLAAVGTEWAITALTKSPRSISDLSAVVTGMLVAFNVPPEIPLWMPMLGSAFAIGVAKMTFGGLGNNFINPALAGRAFLMASYPAAMTTFSAPRTGSISGLSSTLDGISAATPLTLIKQTGILDQLQPLDLQEALPNLFWGNIGGCIGETSVAALLLGAVLLWYKHIIGFRIPLFYIGTVFMLFWLFHGTDSGLFSTDAITIPVFHVLSGGLMLGALFMATDMTTSPVTGWGKVLFAIGCGVLTFAIRRFGGYPEGVSYSILLMNLVVPLLDRYTRPTLYGAKKKRV